MPGRELSDGALQEGVRDTQEEQSGSPAGTSLETPLIGSQPLQQQWHSHLEPTPAVTRAGTAANSFVRGNDNIHSDYVHVAAITTGSREV